MGLGAVSTGGFAPGTFGFAETGGAGGFGFAATGGGVLPPTVLEGREDAGVASSEAEVFATTFFFHGAADPFAAAIPGNTATGFAPASAVTECNEGLGVDRVALAAGRAGGLRPPGRGGGVLSLGFGATNSR